MNEERKRQGGCMCGAVRYVATGEPFSVAHCHCHSCRKHTGAPVVTLAGYLEEQVEFGGDERSRYESTPGAMRGYCRKCGTPLTWEGDGGELGQIVELHLSTFDEPETLAPTAHAFYPERLPWFDIVDDLPRYDGFAELSTVLCHGPEEEDK
ncbi:MAG: GFA family protein [Xanthomonadales bacterium]|nr:GFA family protein [Xanthomonadales bacterium]